MASIAYALSIQHFINSVGAKAGFASIIGLALLILIFFTQSRETANLRRRADEAEQQLYQLQLHVDHLSRQRTQPAPAPATAQTTGALAVAAPPAAAALARSGATRAVPGEQVAAGGGGVATLIPAAPAGMGAPALSSATRLIPLADPEADEISIRALRPSINGDGEHHVSDATVATPPPSPPPSTAAGGGNGVARPPVPVPMPTMANEVAPPPRVALPRQQQRPPARPPVAPPPSRRGSRGSSGRRLNPVFFVLAGILVAAVVAVALIVSSGSGSNPPASKSSGSASASASSTTSAKGSKTSKRHKAAAATVTPSSVTVAVLNGTATSHLAATVLGKLTTAGYKGNFTQNAAETAVTSTIVGYTAPTYRSAALAVAKSLNLGSASVQGASQGDRSKVCGATTACTTQVVVTAGADLAQAG
jgi:hypothetical protein